MRRRLPIFFILVFTILGFWFSYLGQRLIFPLGFPLPVELLLWGLLTIPFGFLVWIPAVYWRRRVRGGNEDGGQSKILAAGYYSLAFLSFLFFFVAARDVALGIYLVLANYLDWPYALIRSSPLFSRPATLAMVVAAALLLWLGRRSAKGKPRLRRVKVPIADLPPALDGFSVAQVSDMHVGRAIGREFVAHVVERLNELKADMIAITGDLVDGTVEELRESIAPLGTLSAEEGVYYVTGNHEYYWGAEEWVEEVRRLGIRPLLNSHQVIERRDAKVVIAGVPDLWAARGEGTGPDARSALSGAPDSHLRILLAHQPRSALAGGAENFHLQLSGHTHGGQFIPWTFVIHLFQPFVRGLNRYRGRWIYVSPGTGYWGPPVRVGSPAEITLLTLVRG
jgi:predicted MPP superfamily phosphohydrolase